MTRSRKSVLEIATSPVVPTEKEVEAMGNRLMAQMGWTAVRFSQARATQQTPGIPDRKYYHPELGVTLWWEAKNPNGRQRPAQRQFQAMAEACGEAYVLGGVVELTEMAQRLMWIGRRTRRTPLVLSLPPCWP